MITKEVKIAAGCLSLFLGALLSVFISMSVIGRASHAGPGWPYFAPGWKILDPGAHDVHIMLLAVVVDTLLFGAVIFTVFYGFVKLIDKLTQ